jgi:hypothetical protein
VDIDERFPAWAPGAESSTRALPSIRAGDFEAIEAAVMETSRGRWFLREFARRNRRADTRLLLKALGQLERAVEPIAPTRDLDGLRAGLLAMAETIASARSGNAAPAQLDRRTGEPSAPPDALDTLAHDIEQATSAVIEAAERMQEAAWALREGGADAGLCGELDRHAAAIHAACARRDLTAQCAVRLVGALRDLERRTGAMLDAWGAPSDPSSPATPDHQGPAPEPRPD